MSRTPVLRRLLTSAACAFLAAPVLVTAGAAHAALPGPDQTAMVSVVPAGTSGVDDSASFSDVSADGRWVVFESAANDVVAGVPNVGNFTQVYLRDLQNDVTTLISERTDGDEADDGDSFDPVISADGRWIAFTSEASELSPLVPTAPAFTQVYVHDTQSMTAGSTLLSAVAMVPGNGDSDEPTISDDGQRVAFRTEAANILGGMLPAQIVLIQAGSGTFTLISAENGSATLAGTDNSANPSLSGDGSVVAFESQANNLTTFTDNGRTQVYARIVSANSTQLVSITDDGNEGGDLNSGNPSVNEDGSLVAFDSFATDLTLDTASDADEQVYVRDMVAEDTELVSVSVTGTWADADADQPSISSDGNRIAFSSGASDLVANVTVPSNTGQIWVRDRSESISALVSRSDSDPSVGAGPSLRFASAPAISQNGLYVAFESDQTDLTVTPTGDLNQVYLRALPHSFIPPTPTPTPSPSSSGSANPGTGAKGALASTGATETLAVLALGSLLAAGGVATIASLARGRRAGK